MMSKTQEIDIDMENDLPKRKLPKDLYNLSVFNYQWNWKSWRGFWRNLIYFFKCLRPAYHRATKGYCRMDTWNADSTITTYLIKVLTEYRNVTNGYPGDENFSTFESWIAYIDEIIDLLIYSDTFADKMNVFCKDWEEECCSIPRSEWKDRQHYIYEHYIAENERIYNKQKEAREKAFAMLGKHLNHIWW
jgi:hypothetical protein